MLSNQEKMVMSVIYEICSDKSTCLVKPIEILKKIPYRNNFNFRDLENILSTLQLDDYFEWIKSDRKGELTYCITLHANGMAFKRSLSILRRTIGFKITLAVAAAGVTFLVGKLLSMLF